MTGVPPVVQAPTFLLEAMAEDNDPAIDASLETLVFLRRYISLAVFAQQRPNYQPIRLAVL